MQKPRYELMIVMLDKLPEPNRTACMRLYDENRQRLLEARGSTHNHQAWDGGYFDHVQEVMNYATLFYRMETSTGRPLPFTLEDAWLALFLHDIEKPWRFERVNGEWRNIGTMQNKADRDAFRRKKIAEYGIILTPEVENAVRYAEGEGEDYRSDRRVSNELAGFVHVCDHFSARVRYDYPKHGDPWSGMITHWDPETENEG